MGVAFLLQREHLPDEAVHVAVCRLPLGISAQELFDDGREGGVLVE